MTPRRWLDHESDATSAERELLRADLEAEPPAFAERDVWQRLSASIGVPDAGSVDAPDLSGASGVSSAASATGVSHATSTVMATFLKGVALGVGVTAAAVGAQKALEGPVPAVEQRVAHEARPAPPVTGSPPNRVVTSPGPPHVAFPEPAVPSSAVRAAPPPAPIGGARKAEAVPSSAGSVAVFPAPLAASSRLSEEARLLRRARAELQAGSLALAFATLEASRERFATPELAQEREALTIELLHKSGQRAAADQRARAFLQQFPDSPHAARLRGFLTRAP